MRSCCICKKNVGRSVSFFKIPTEEWRRSKWIAVCKRQFSHKDGICSDHFLPTDIIKGSIRDNLMPGAVPSIGLFPKEVKVYPRHNQTQTDATVLERILQRYETKHRNLQEELKDLKRQFAEKNGAITFMRSIFTEGQMNKMMKPGEQVQWNRNDISNAIRLHASGPKTYNYLYKKKFPLPPASTLEFSCRKVIVSEGFLTTSLGFMKHCTELTSKDKICVLSFDEMKVLDVDENDTFGNSKRKTADYAQVVMAQGLWKPWKRPVFFDYDSEMKKDVLYSIIEKLNQSQFSVVAIVCDMKATNLKLWLDLGVTKDKPWFPNPVKSEEKVFTFGDASHLLELTKNQFLSIGLLWKNELLTSRAIEDLMKLTRNSGDTSITLKGGHKVAERLFSKTTANALRLCYSEGINLYKPIETADFIQLVSDWYDLLSSTTNSLSTPGKEPFGTALADQQRTLMRMNNLMSSPLIPNKTTLEYFQEGIVITNKALVQLYDYIKPKFGMTYILTNHINQHELKHLFDVIRNEGALHEHPTSQEFKDRLRKYIMEQNIEHFHGRIDDTSDTPSSTNTMASRKPVSNQKIIDDIEKQHCGREHEVLDEMIVNRNSEILLELETANLDDVDTFDEGTQNIGVSE